MQALEGDLAAAAALRDCIASGRTTRSLTVPQVVIIGDGQVTMGAEIVKPNVKKVRRIGTDVIGGFAGATADAFTLFERLETKLEEHPVRGCADIRSATVCRRAESTRGLLSSPASRPHTSAPALSAGPADTGLCGACQELAHGQVPAPPGRAFRFSSTLTVTAHCSRRVAACALADCALTPHTFARR